MTAFLQCVADAADNFNSTRGKILIDTKREDVDF